MAPPRTYLALGDSMSIDQYTGVDGGGAVRQVYACLREYGWQLDDRTADGCRMELVPTDGRGDLVTLTIGGNDLIEREVKWMAHGLVDFGSEHKRLLESLRARNENAEILVANIYRPQTALAEDLQIALDTANQMIADNCGATGCTLIDVASAFRGREEILLVEDIEPSLAGASVIATVFLLELRRLGLVGA